MNVSKILVFGRKDRKLIFRAVQRLPVNKGSNLLSGYCSILSLLMQLMKMQLPVQLLFQILFWLFMKTKEIVFFVKFLIQFDPFSNYR